MVDGAALAARRCSRPRAPPACGATTRGANLLDGGAPLYDTYRDARRQVSSPSARSSRSSTPSCCERLGPRRRTSAGAARPRRLARDARRASRARFATRTRDEWCALFDGTDACFAPVLTLRRGARRIRTRSPVKTHGTAQVSQLTGRVCRVTQRRGVEYLLVGGYALPLTGGRVTGDIDFCVRPDPDNAQRLLEALGQFGFGALGLGRRLRAERSSAGLPAFRIDR